MAINQLSRELSAHNHGVPEYVIQKIVALADENGDRFITYSEFIRLVRSTVASSLPG